MIGVYGFRTNYSGKNVLIELPHIMYKFEFGINYLLWIKHENDTWQHCKVRLERITPNKQLPSHRVEGMYGNGIKCGVWTFDNQVEIDLNPSVTPWMLGGKK